jgi:hypothetical protein
MVEAIAGDAAAEAAALERMQEHYRQAEALATTDPEAEFFYPALNRIAAEVALNAGRDEWPGLAPELTTTVAASLDARAKADPDFWSIVGQTELRLYEALSAGQVAKAQARLEEAWRDLHARVGSDYLWRSVYDTAHFVLPKYAARVTGSERDAANQILAVLGEFAGVRSVARATTTSHRKRALGRKGGRGTKRKQVR